ncbi:MAG: hypothetical protein WAT93_09720 [Pontixanthobacter sp.]
MQILQRFIAGFGILVAGLSAADNANAETAPPLTCDTSLAEQVASAVRGLGEKYTPDILGAIQNAAVACPANADIQLGFAVALYRASAVSTEPEQKLTAYSMLWDQLMAIDALTEYPKDFEALSFLSRNIVVLLSEHAAANEGKTIAAFANAEPLARCPRSATSMAQEMWYPHLSKSRFTVYSPLFMKKLADACLTATTDLSRQPVLFYGEYLMGQAIAKSDPDQKMALAAEALPYLAPWPKSPSLNKQDIEKLLRQKAKMEAELMALPDMTKVEFWQGSDQLDEYRRAAIGYQADIIWGVYLSIDSATGSADEKRTAMRAYRDFVTALEKVAAPVGPQASRVLYEGLDGHADGTYRSEAFKGRTGPPDSLRHMTDPNRTKVSTH